jgi:pimeloyl-ACP methyl ester carboxylesterase
VRFTAEMVTGRCHEGERRVDSMTTTADHLVTLPDGRILAFDEYGDPDGPVVVLLPGTPGSRRLDPDPAATTAAGVRLLVVDRPGYGASSPWPSDAAPTLDLIGDDVAEALTRLGVAEAAVVGWSSGGQFALALAARHPELVRSLVLVGMPAPDDEVPWIPDQHRPLLHAMRADPASASAQLAPALARISEHPAAALPEIAFGPADDAALAAAGRHDQLEAMLAEGLRHGADGVVADIVAVNVSPPGFDPTSVGARATLVYGTDDVIVTPAHGRYWAGIVPGAELHLVAGAGHLVALTAWADILHLVAEVPSQ